MLNLDKKVDTDKVQIDKKQYPFKVLRPAEGYKFGEELDILIGKITIIKTEEEEEECLVEIHDLLEKAIDAPRDVIEKFDYEHFFRLIGYLRNKPLTDQGFTDAEIKRMERAQFKKALNDIE